METMIEQLAGAAGEYHGHGDGAESGPFKASIAVSPVLDGLGVEIAYEAVDPKGDRLHVERTLLTFDMMSGEPTLFVLCDELRGMGQLRQVADYVFSNGAGHDGFELQVEIAHLTDADGHELTYVWSWGPPQADLAEQSRAVVRQEAR